MGLQSVGEWDRVVCACTGVSRVCGEGRPCRGVGQDLPCSCDSDGSPELDSVRATSSVALGRSCLL